MAQFLRPDSDVAITSWAGSPTTSGIWQNIDESTASNTDFLYSGNNPNGSGCEIGLSNPGGTPQSGTCTVRWNDAKLNGTTLSSSGSAVSLDVQILEGATIVASSGATTITGAWTARSFTFSTSAVTNWDDLRVKFVATGGGGSPSNRRGAGVSWAEIETPDAATAITGTMAAAETGADTFAASGTVTDPAITGNLAATESGIDSFAGTGGVAVTGAMDASDAGVDAANASGSVAVSGALAATENETDTFSAAGSVDITGSLASSESGADVFAGSGSVTDPGIVGTMAAVEAGNDNFASSGAVSVAGAMAAAEIGNDGFSGSGLVAVTGGLAINESGADTMAATGTVEFGEITGTLSAAEDGPDASAITGLVLISGSLSASETGADSFSARESNNTDKKNKKLRWASQKSASSRLLAA